MIILYIKTYCKREKIFVFNLDTHTNKDYNQYKIILFLVLKVVFFLAFRWRYYNKTSAILLALP